MSTIQPKNTSYGLSQAIINNAPQPVAAKRDPTVRDLMQIGTVWCNTTTDSVSVLASITNNTANWVNIAAGAGLFTSLLVTPGNTSLAATTIRGTTNINTVGNANTAIGGAANSTDIEGTVDINTDLLVNGVTNIGVGGNAAVHIGNATGDTFIDDGDLNIQGGDVVLGINNAAYTFLNGVKIVSGNGDPNGVAVFTSPIGSLYLNGTPTGTTDRLFVNTNGGTAWTYFPAHA